MIEPDPHGIVEVFAGRLNQNLKLTGPESATKEAIQTVQGYMNASKFIDMSHKGSTERERSYVRVWKRPEEMGK